MSQFVVYLRENEEFLSIVQQFEKYARDRLGYDTDVTIEFVHNEDNADKELLSKTALYDFKTHTVKVYVTERHPKDILRSLSHELVHHYQNDKGMFDDVDSLEDGYAQDDPVLRDMEKQAYLRGNLIFRDFTDTEDLPSTMYSEEQLPTWRVM